MLMRFYTGEYVHMTSVNKTGKTLPVSPLKKKRERERDKEIKYIEFENIMTIKLKWNIIR